MQQEPFLAHTRRRKSQAEMMADEWLADKDAAGVIGRRRRTEYPYLTDRQYYERTRKEIPIGNVDIDLSGQVFRMAQNAAA